MRRAATVAAFAAACAVLVVGCGGGTYVSALPVTVVGKVNTTTPKGNAAAGKTLFLGQAGCGGCHTYTPAGSKGTVGPDLDHLAADAQKANHGSLADYIHESVVSPNAYIVPGFSGPPSAMPSYAGQLSEQQIADLVAFLSQGAK
jgi:mono/diheme cytochrome c family protein